MIVIVMILCKNLNLINWLYGMNDVIVYVLVVFYNEKNVD